MNGSTIKLIRQRALMLAFLEVKRLQQSSIAAKARLIGREFTRAVSKATEAYEKQLKAVWNQATPRKRGELRKMWQKEAKAS